MADWSLITWLETIAVVIYLPFGVYFTYKYALYRNHFIITKRNPQLSYQLLFLLVYIMIQEVVTGWLRYFGVVNSKIETYLDCFLLVCVYAIGMLTYYRMYLIYRSWKQATSQLKYTRKSTIFTESNMQLHRINATRKLSLKWLFHTKPLIYVSIFLGSTCLVLGVLNESLAFLIGVAWTPVLIFGIVACVLSTRATERLGLVKEGWVCIFVVVVVVVVVSYFWL